jgi:hypothetical protein
MNVHKPKNLLETSNIFHKVHQTRAKGEELTYVLPLVSFTEWATVRPLRSLLCSLHSDE